jgi:TonB family protein
MSKVKLMPLALLLFLMLPAAIHAQVKPDEEGQTAGRAETRELKTTDSEGAAEGAVRLRVTFQADGTVGEVVLVHGLTEAFNQQAIDAARKMKFTPAVKNGVPVSVTKTVEYTFTRFYEENDAALQKIAEITSRPAPERPEGKNFKNLAGKVRLKLTLKSDGKVEIGEIESDLPPDFQEKARQAAAKIKFRPAVHKNGAAVDQTKEIQYEFKSKNN